MTLYFKKVLFYFICSFVISVSGYYLLKLVLPGHQVFAAWIRMFKYHEQQPLAYIAIPCFFYSLIIPKFDNLVAGYNIRKQVKITLLLCLSVVLLSSPFGGMLWVYHDMKAGFFPENWFLKVVSFGFPWGLQIGWFVVLFSFHYTFLGIVVCFYLNKTGTRFFH